MARNQKHLPRQKVVIKMDNIKVQTVVEGEASESDEDEEVSSIMRNEGQANESSQKGVDNTNIVVISGEASESDEETDGPQQGSKVSRALPDLRVNHEEKGDLVSGESEGEMSPGRSLSATDKDKPKYDTLLHRKLRERNACLRKNLSDLVGQMYTTGAKDIHNTTQQLVKSQTAIQDVSHNMRLLTNDLFHLEDRIDIIRCCNILPPINIQLVVEEGVEATASPH